MYNIYACIHKIERKNFKPENGFNVVADLYMLLISDLIAFKNTNTLKYIRA